VAAATKHFDDLRTPNARARRLRLARESRQPRGVLRDPLAGQSPPPISPRASLRRAGALVDRAGTRTAAGGRGAGARVAKVYEPGARRAGDLLVWSFATILGLAFLEAALSGRGPAAVQKFLGLLGGGISKFVDPSDPLFGKTSPSPGEAAGGAGLPTSVTGPSSIVAPGPAGEHPGPGAGHTGRNAGGFLPRTALYIPGRADQGRDGQTGPRVPIIAPGAGRVVAVKSDPGGFGPAYPVVKFSSGPYAGQTLYIGHRISALRVGARFRAGQVIAKAAPHGLGNASTPGWFEIGFAPGGAPGPMGQPTPF
jgi:hypothetical protein